MLWSAVSPVAVLAQAEGSPPAPGAVGLPQDACALASPEELSAIDPTVTLTLAITAPGACNYAGSPLDRPFAGAFLTVAARSTSPVGLAGDMRDVAIGAFDGRLGSRDVIVNVGPWLLRINGIIPTADPGAWLVAAAAIAAPRLAALTAADAQGPICPRLGAAAVQGILGVPIGKVAGSADSCTWSTGDSSANLPSYVNVDARVEVGDLAIAGLAFKDVEDVDVAGRKGAWVASERRLYVESGSGGLVTVTFVAAPEEVATRDHAIALAAALFEAGAA
jgi:hypothetical protein